MEYSSQLLEIRNATQARLDELNEEIQELMAEQAKIAETLNELICELEQAA